MTLFGPFVALVVTAAFLSLLIDIYAHAMRATDPPEMQPRPQIPADDLIGKELRDVR